jgi:simple sugar transport system permease protein
MLKQPAFENSVVIGRLLATLILIAIALLIGAGAIALTGQSPLVALQELIAGAIGTRTNIAAMLTRSIPIIITGLAALMALRAGIFNLGMEGQMVLGALTCAAVANALSGFPPLILLPLVIVSGCLAGGMWALLAGWWQTQFKVPAVVTTLLLNYIAIQFAAYLANFPLRDLSGGAAVAQTPMIPEAIRIGILLPGTRLHWGVLVIIVLPVLLRLFLERTRLGYELRMVGLNALFARYGGINSPRTVLWAMFSSGAIAALAGVVQVLSVDFRYIDGSAVAAGFAWTGFIAAILAQSNPLLVVLSGIFLGGLEVGAAGMQRNTQIPLQIADVVQAGIIFMIAVRERLFSVVQGWLSRRPTTSPSE